MANYTLTIGYVPPATLDIKLSQGGKVLDTVQEAFDKNADTVLLTTVDKFLKRNRIDPLSISTVEVDERIDKNSSLYKIVRTFQIAFQASKK